jgi:hypothetical protein
VYPPVLLIYFISAAVILVSSLALMVQFSQPYNKVGRASVLYNFIVFMVFFGLKTLFIKPVIFRYLLNLLSMLIYFSWDVPGFDILM